MKNFQNENRPRLEKDWEPLAYCNILAVNDDPLKDFPSKILFFPKNNWL